MRPYDQPDQSHLPVLDFFAVDAKISQRLISYGLDCLIAGAIGGFAATLLSKLGLPASIGGLGSFFGLWVWIPGVTGQTLGMRLIGLRYVNRGSNSAEIPSLKSIALRETVGRLFCGMSLGVGYAAMLWRSDRRGWHDALSGVSVVADDNGMASQSSTARGFAAVALIVLTLGAGSAWYLVFTAAPLRSLTDRMQLEGYVVEGVAGNWLRGYSIKRIAKKTSTGSFEVNGVRFLVRLKLHNNARELVIGNFEIDSARQVIESAEAPAPTLEKIKTPTSKSVVADALPWNLRIDAIDVSDVIVESKIAGHEQTYAIKRVFASNLLLQHGEPNGKLASFSGDRIYVESDFADLDVRSFELSSAHMRTLQPIWALIKPPASPLIIARPMDIQLQIDFENGQLASLKGSALAGGLKLSCTHNTCDIEGHRLTPSQWVKISAPIHSIELFAKADAWPFRITKLETSANWRTARFNSRGAAMLHMRPNRAFVLGLASRPNAQPITQPVAQRASASTAPPLAAALSLERAFTIRSFAQGSNGTTAASADAPAVLAELYFARPFAQLSPLESKFVMDDAQFFESVAPSPPGK